MHILKILGIVLILIALIVVLLMIVLRDVPIPKPTGMFKVGSGIISFEDAQRECPFTGKKRKVFARIFYPTDEQGKEYEPYIDSALADAYAEQMGIPRVAFGKEVSSFAARNVAVSSSENSYPVILFNHGNGAFMKSNMAQFQELVSQGYIVISIGHAFESAYIPFADGAVTMTPAKLREMKELNKNPSELGKDLERSLIEVRNAKNMTEYTEAMRHLTAENKIYASLEESVTLWTEDTKSVIHYLRKIQESDKTEAVIQVMDLERIGVYGHSLGGIIAGEVCVQGVEGVRCGINMDAPQLLYQEAYQSYQVPFGFINSDVQKVGKSEIKLEGVHDMLLNEASVPTFSCTFEESAHYDFCDMTFTTAMKKFTPMLGKIDPLLMNETLNKTLLLFFNAYLKEESLETLEKYHSTLSHTRFKNHPIKGE